VKRFIWEESAKEELRRIEQRQALDILRALTAWPTARTLARLRSSLATLTTATGFDSETGVSCSSTKEGKPFTCLQSATARTFTAADHTALLPVLEWRENWRYGRRIPLPHS
jgi:hypothetical protein